MEPGSGSGTGLLKKVEKVTGITNSYNDMDV